MFACGSSALQLFFERRSAGAFPQSRWNRGILFAVLELLFRAVFLFSAAELKNGLHGSSEHNAADFAYLLIISTYKGDLK